MLFPTAPIELQRLEDDLFEQQQVSVAVLRLDLIHPVVSGNKLFKLHYFLIQALQEAHQGIVTFGGAYSNHLVATAFACNQMGLGCAGIIRGEKPAVLSHTLQACAGYGMEFQFVSREHYSHKDDPAFITDLQSAYKNYLVVPEGGYHPMGAAGAALIMELIKDAGATHTCCAAGTATTCAGLLMGLQENQQLLCFPVLKNMTDLESRIQYLTNCTHHQEQLVIWPTYHFGGYAKKNKLLLDSMNLLFEKHRLPTDFVYTGKMMYGVMDLIKTGVFPPGSNIICIHTGGLQGNLSLPPGSLIFQ